ncbi:MAG: leukotriene-A4 hydrolase [Gammaproteobacteria bacterium]|jgi:aminopeptidase N|nr:leukotriene-A4 hydrolase [Gammaproteobacteria bacterium]
MRVCVAGLVLACAGSAAAGAGLPPIEPGLDYHSFANVDQFRVTHIELDLRVDLEGKVIGGTAALELKRLDPRATQLVLDTKALMINDVTQKATDVLGATAKNQTIWVSRPFHLEKADPILGSALVIELPPTRKPVESIRIDYETLPTASALQWLTPKQTAGRRRGFLYTQSEPIGTRTWIPLQDTPQVRATYKARIHTSADVVAVMSAENDPKAKRNGEYLFVMPQAVPSYLIALAVGDLEFKETGPRTGVYAEKPLIKAAAKEFADTEAMIAASEKMFGPYRWTRYDILVLPPSFPVGGMENPRLSFITPTVIAGDKSLVSVIAHELAHSWSGNLVTNATWRDLWLNEGFTDHLESRIMEAVYGEQRASMERVLGLESLRRDLAKLQPKDQVLAIDLRDRDPELVFSDVPYQKGRLFLSYLDAKFGRDRFDAFLRGYFDHFAFKSITTEQFNQYLTENLLDRFPGIVTRQQVLAWENDPGLPADAVLPVSSAFQPVAEARTAWLGGTLQAKKFGLDWVTQQWLYFLDGMPAALSAAQLGNLDQAYGLTRSQNAEIGHSWLELVIRNNYQPGYARLEEYLKTIGRRKLIAPLYAELMKTPSGSEFAKRVYAKARPGYHPDTAAAIDAIVNPAAAEGS